MKKYALYFFIFLGLLIPIAKAQFIDQDILKIKEVKHHKSYFMMATGISSAKGSGKYYFGAGPNILLDGISYPKFIKQGKLAVGIPYSILEFSMFRFSSTLISSKIGLALSAHLFNNVSLDVKYLVGACYFFESSDVTNKLGYAYNGGNKATPNFTNQFGLNIKHRLNKHTSFVYGILFNSMQNHFSVVASDHLTNSNLETTYTTSFKSRISYNSFLIGFAFN